MSGATARATCHYHHATPAVATCRLCARHVCGLCARTVNAAALCAGCAVGRETQKPWLAVVFGVLLPGAGQVYNGEIGRGVLLFVLSPLVVPWVWAVFDAARVAGDIAEGRRPGSAVPTGAVLLALKILWFPAAALFVTMIVSLLAVVAAAAAAL